MVQHAAFRLASVWTVVIGVVTLKRLLVVLALRLNLDRDTVLLLRVCKLMHSTSIELGMQTQNKRLVDP